MHRRRRTGCLREGISVPFFGHPARTSISHIKIAVKKQVPLFYMRTERLGTCRFRVTISPPITLPDTADDAAVLALASEINHEIESWIRTTPEQWFWPPGNMSAAIKACETVDDCCEKIIKKAIKHDYTTLVIADHGNSDMMINEDGSPNTAHTTNLVPLIVVDNEIKNIDNGILGDIAPTILEIMNIVKPEKMTCKSLLK